MATGRGGGNSEPGGGGAGVVDLHSAVQTVEAEYDDEGVFFYQAFNGAIADWALANQRFGGPHFSTSRMFVTCFFPHHPANQISRTPTSMWWAVHA
jgi:hypothetical protein